MNNTKPVFGFQKQMAVGDRGEADFALHYKNLEPLKSSDLAFDFNLVTGATVELKTDDYSMSKTQNFFMETVGDTKSGKLGGPFRALKDNVDYFIYYFIRDKTFFWFKPEQLCPKLEELIASGKYPVKEIQNRGWVTQGYAIPRKLLEPILIQQDFFP